MKKLITISLVMLIALSATQMIAQVKIGDNPTTIDANSLLEIETDGHFTVVEKDTGFVGVGVKDPVANLHIKDDGVGFPYPLILTETEGVGASTWTHRLYNDGLFGPHLSFVRGGGTLAAPTKTLDGQRVLAISGSSGIGFGSNFLSTQIVGIRGESIGDYVSQALVEGRLILQAGRNGVTGSFAVLNSDTRFFGVNIEDPTVQLDVFGELRVRTKFNDAITGNTNAGTFETGVPNHVSPEGTIIFQNAHFYGNVDGTATGWKRLDVD